MLTHCSSIRQHEGISLFKSILLVAVLFLIAVFGRAQEADLCSILKLTEGNSSQVFYKKSAIPVSVKRIIEKEEIFGSPFRIANPKQKYRANDVVTRPLLPTNRLAFLIQNAENYVVVFEHGGRGKRTYCIMVNPVNNNLIYSIVPTKSAISYEKFISYLRSQCEEQ